MEIRPLVFEFRVKSLELHHVFDNFSVAVVSFLPHKREGEGNKEKSIISVNS